MSKFFTFLFVTLYLSLGLKAQPTISSLNPSKGAVGTNIVITGTGFNSNPALNIINFGGVRVVASAATTTSLTVAVPTGTSPHVPVSVTVAGLTGYSPVPFITTFPGADAPFTDNSFDFPTYISTPSYSTDIAVSDLDLDGKTDVVIIDNYSSILIYRNIGTATTISVAAPLIIDNTLSSYSVSIADINGDGLPDIVVGTTNNGGNDSVSVYRNTSSIGTISFALAARIAAPGSAYGIVTGDLDADGKPDIVSTTNTGVYVFRNTSSGGIISFNAGLLFPGQYPQAITIRDINGNSKPDILIADGNNAIMIMNNTSIPGNISFDAAQNVGNVYSAVGIEAADLDGDGKIDIVVSSYNGSAAAILQNTGSGSVISYAAPVTLYTSSPWGVKLGDMNGDGKLDIVCPQNSVTHNVSVFRNTSTIGNISFDAAADFYTGAKNFKLALADLRNTGLPDIITMQNETYQVAFLKNKANDPPTMTSFSPAAAGQGFEVTITGTNLSSVTGVNFGGVPATAINIISPTSIKAMVSTGASGNVTVVSPAGTVSLPGFTFTSAPSISSFSPMSGPVGQTVIINGSNFSPTAANNIVYFGAVKATVTSATTNSLIVKVPAGATWQPVSVTTNGYTVFTQRPFNITFPDGDINAASFIKKISRYDGFQTYVKDVKIGDIDGDGLSDIIVTLHGTVLSDVTFHDSIAVYRNTTVNGIVSFAQRVAFKTTGSMTGNMVVGDFNSDGKLDVAVINQPFVGGYADIDLFRNSSVPGSISFATPTGINGGSYNSQLSIGDLDGDGKPDLAIATGDTLFYVFKNASSGSVIQFTNRQTIAVPGANVLSICIADIDSDNKPDILIANTNSHTVPIFKNTSTIGTINLNPTAGYDAGRGTSFVTAADMDGDGKNDIVLASGYYSYSGAPQADSAIILGRNIGSAGNMSFDTPVVSQIANAGGLELGDLDGNSVPDIVTTSDITYFTTFKNTSTSGNLSLAPKLTFNIGSPAIAIANAVGDLDGDGKPDIVLGDDYESNIFVYINQNGSDAELCPNGSKTLLSNITGTVYQWQVNTGSGFVNIANGANYSGVNTAALNLINIPSSWYGYNYRCVVNGANSKITTIRFVNHWTGAVSSSWETPGNWSCGSVPDINTDVILSTGTIILSSNASIRSLQVDPNVSLTVHTGFTLTVLH